MSSGIGVSCWVLLVAGPREAPLSVLLVFGVFVCRFIVVALAVGVKDGEVIFGSQREAGWRGIYTYVDWHQTEFIVTWHLRNGQCSYYWLQS